MLQLLQLCICFPLIDTFDASASPSILGLLHRVRLDGLETRHYASEDKGAEVQNLQDIAFSLCIFVFHTSDICLLLPIVCITDIGSHNPRLLLPLLTIL